MDAKSNTLMVPPTSQPSNNVRNRGNIPNPLGLTHPKPSARYNVLSSMLVIATCCYDEVLLTRLGLLDDNFRLFGEGGMG